MEIQSSFASTALLLVLVPSLVAAGRSLYDPYIICYGSVPPFDSPWPAKRSPDDYPQVRNNNLFLCSDYHGRNYNNLGCRCSTDQGNPHCGVGADPVLSGAQMDSTVAMPSSFFLGWCLRQCFCVSRVGAEDGNEIALSSVSTSTQTNTTLNLGTNPFGDDITNSTAEPYDAFGGGFNFTSNAMACGANCTTAADCS